MVFSELYSAYYQTVAEVLKQALEHPVKAQKVQKIVAQYAFGESILKIPSALGENWQLLKADGTTVLENEPTMPLTLLQKRWLKAIALDPRIQLFGDTAEWEPDAEPLFTPEDYILFDRYADGDDYRDEAYIAHFRMILHAIAKQQALQIVMKNRMGNAVALQIMPDHLEYSEKDDKFRLIGISGKYESTINLGRIISCEPSKEVLDGIGRELVRPGKCSVTFELEDHRNALERVLLHFAHHEKRAEKLAEKRYRVTVAYEADDETEMVIRLLAFGPMVKVIKPERFVHLIKERLKRQKGCGR